MRQGGKSAVAAGWHARLRKSACWLLAPGHKLLASCLLQVEYILGKWSGSEEAQQEVDRVQVSAVCDHEHGWVGAQCSCDGARCCCLLSRMPRPACGLLAPSCFRYFWPPTTHSMRPLPSCLPVQIDTSDVGGATPYVAQQYTAGDSCELTGRPREAEVRFTCGSSPDTLMVSVREPSSCTYTVTIATPRLCKHPAFQQQPPPATLIQCHALPEEGGGTEAAGAGSCAAADSSVEHGSCAADASVPAAADAAGGAASQPAASGKQESEAAAVEDGGEHADVEEEPEEDEYADAEDEAAGPAAADDDPSDPYL